MEVLTAEAAVRAIKDGDTVGVCGSGNVLDVSPILAALEARFIAEGHPRDLTDVNPVIPGLDKGSGGLNHFAHPGFLKRIITGGYHDDRCPALHRMVTEGKIEAYNPPMGMLYQALDAAAGRRPGVLTQVGLGTQADPLFGGCRMNDATPADLVERMQWHGEDYLMFHAIPLDIAIIRATFADEDGNLSLRHEPAYLGVATLAMAAKAHGGKVIAQVGGIVERGSLDPREVKIPGRLVDFVVVAPAQEQVTHLPFNPALCGNTRAARPALAPIPADARGVIVRRAARELVPGYFVNIGFGLYTSLPAAADTLGLLEKVTFSIEHGQIGGYPGSATGGVFPSAVNPAALVDPTFTFTMYDGGVLDLTYLSFAEVGARGDVNISRFGSHQIGVGGFVNISHGARKVVFGGTMTTAGLKTRCTGGRLVIEREGDISRFVGELQQRNFVGQDAFARGQEVMFITERAVFQLTAKGMVLTEIAPGFSADDIQRVVKFPIQVSDAVQQMDSSLFV